MPNQKAPASENTEPEAEGNRFEYDCEPGTGLYSEDELYDMLPPELKAVVDARKKALAARNPQNQGGDDGAQ